MALVKLCGLPVIKISAQFHVFYWSCCPKIPPKTGPIGSWTKESSFFSEYVGKVKNRKYPEVETWHPENVDEWSSYRLCENFWWPFGVAPGGNLDSIWTPKIFFLLIFTRILWFFWELGLMFLDILKDVVFAEILVFSNNFGSPGVNWTPKCS